MSQAILQKEVEKHGVIFLDQRFLSCLSDPIRFRIIQALSHKPMNAEQICKTISSTGHTKTTSTVRHHLAILKKCGLVQVSRIEETRGAITKYYASTIYLIEPRKGSEASANTKLIADLSKKLGKLAFSVALAKEQDGLSAKSTCTLCTRDHVKDAMVLEAFNAALTKMLDSSEFAKSKALTVPATKQAKPAPRKANDA